MVGRIQIVTGTDAVVGLPPLIEVARIEDERADHRERGGAVENVVQTTGRRFRDLILAKGAEAPATALVDAFLGRPVSPDAFFREIRGASD